MFNLSGISMRASEPAARTLLVGEGQGGPLMTEQTDGGGEVWGSSTAVRTVPPPAGAGARVVQTGGLVTGPVAAPRTRQAVGPASHTAAVQPCLPGPAPAFSSGVGQRLPGSWVGEQLSGHGDAGASADSLGSPPPVSLRGGSRRPGAGGGRERCFQPRVPRRGRHHHECRIH